MPGPPTVAEATVPKSNSGLRWAFFAFIRAGVAGSIGTAVMLLTYGCLHGSETTKLLLVQTPVPELCFAGLAYLALMALVVSECRPHAPKTRPEQRTYS
jgi:hypothetical protein